MAKALASQTPRRTALPLRENNADLLCRSIHPRASISTFFFAVSHHPPRSNKPRNSVGLPALPPPAAAVPLPPLPHEPRGCEGLRRPAPVLPNSDLPNSGEASTNRKSCAAKAVLSGPPGSARATPPAAICNVRAVHVVLALDISGPDAAQATTASGDTVPISTAPFHSNGVIEIDADQTKFEMQQQIYSAGALPTGSTMHQPWWMLCGGQARHHFWRQLARKSSLS